MSIKKKKKKKEKKRSDSPSAPMQQRCQSTVGSDGGATATASAVAKAVPEGEQPPSSGGPTTGDAAAPARSMPLPRRARRRLQRRNRVADHPPAHGRHGGDPATQIQFGRVERTEDGVIHSTVMMTRERLRQIAEQQPHTTVYEWEYDDAAEVLPMAVVEPLLRTVRNTYLALRAEHPDWSDDEARAEIHRRNPEVHRLFANHATLFRFMTSRDTDADHERRIWYMTYLRSLQERGEIDEAEAQVSLARFLQEGLLRADGATQPPQGGHAAATRRKPPTGAERRRARRQRQAGVRAAAP
jgi:hypothetical protein